MKRKSRNATAKQKRMFGRVFELGCLACRQDKLFSYPQIHHWREYGYRNHDLIYGLCKPHHDMRHLHKPDFVAKYGADKELFEESQKLLGIVK